MKVTSSNQRLKELLNIFGDTQSDMVRKTGIEKSAISNYINGRREARQDKLILIANAYNVNPGWLMGLDVNMYNDSHITSHQKKAKSLECTPEEEEIIYAYRKADEVDKNSVRKILNVSIGEKESVVS